LGDKVAGFFKDSFVGFRAEFASAVNRKEQGAEELVKDAARCEVAERPKLEYTAQRNGFIEQR
jgi:hypothetical protein